MLEQKTISGLKGKKNLLAFSGGVDSSALFFLLLKDKIKFDIAIVNYGLREQSKNEISYAKELAQTHNLKCHIFNAPIISNNFEAKAREIRYNFFEELIKTHQYNNLITAHHLGDRFEWMLMQFCKGAGCAEIAGMQKEQERGFYTLIRPLLHLDKQELLTYLHANDKKYFQDETNLDEDIKRNSFRHNYSMPLLEKYLSGIKKSFDYLDEDKESLILETKLHVDGNFAYFKNSNSFRTNIYYIDKYLKSIGYMMSANEREILKDEKTLVVGRKFVVNQDKRYVFITPYTQSSTMSKEFKEQMRVLHVEPKLRPYFYENKKSLQKLKELLSSI